MDWPAVKGYAEQIIPIIREKAPDSVIIVGNPDWSKDLYSVAADPLAFDNILYTLHFYSATHGQDYRDMTEKLSQQGLPIFVSEFGVTAASGGLPRDLEGADQWIELLEQENISYCMWAFAKAAEACSTIRFTVPPFRYRFGLCRTAQNSRFLSVSLEKTWATFPAKEKRTVSPIS